MSCWTLWQRMPPRYQLTMRDVRSEDDAPLAQQPQAQHQQQHPQPEERDCHAPPPLSSATPRLRSARGIRRVGSARRVGEDHDGMMLTTAVVTTSSADGDWPSTGGPPPHSPRLPARSSAYISNMKNTMRNNSARKLMDNGSFPLYDASAPYSVQARTVAYSPKARANTAPAFPITRPANTQLYHLATGYPHTHGPQKDLSGRKGPRRPASGHSQSGDGERRLSLPTTTLAPFGEVRDGAGTGSGSGPNPWAVRLSPRQQDCVIGEYQVAALYVDKGRVTFFRKTRPDVTQSVYSAMNPFLSRDDGGYLAHLRKAYLSGVRDMPKILGHLKTDMKKHVTVRQRMNYDRKIDRILDYYAKVDTPTEVYPPRRPDDGSGSGNHLLTADTQQAGFKPLHARQKATMEGLNSGSDLTDNAGQSVAVEGVPGMTGGQETSGVPCYGSRPAAVSPWHLQPQVGLPWQQQQQFSTSLRDSAEFVRINARARLHNRFYLRTPGQGADNSLQGGEDPLGRRADDSCECAMCRLEMEVAFVAHLHGELGVSAEAVALARHRASLMQQQQGPSQKRVGTHQHDDNQANDLGSKDGSQCNKLLQGSLAAVIEEDCPARPNSASDLNSDAPSARQETNIPSNQSAERLSETTTLKVTLPNAEETGSKSSDKETARESDVVNKESEDADSTNCLLLKTDSQSQVNNSDNFAQYLGNQVTDKYLETKIDQKHADIMHVRDKNLEGKTEEVNKPGLSSDADETKTDKEIIIQTVMNNACEQDIDISEKLTDNKEPTDDAPDSDHNKVGLRNTITIYPKAASSTVVEIRLTQVTAELQIDNATNGNEPLLNLTKQEGASHDDSEKNNQHVER